MSKQHQYPPQGILAHEVYDTLSSLVYRAYAQAQEFIVPQVEVSSDCDGFSNEAEATKAGYTRNVVISALISVLVTSAGIMLSAPDWCIAALAGLGAIIGSVIQSKSNKPTSASVKPVKTLTPEDIHVKLSVDDAKRGDLLDNAVRDVMELCEAVADYERKNNEKADIEIDRNFGEWVQDFLVYADNNPDDEELQVIKKQLIHRLTMLNIHVYSELDLDDSGKPNLPYPDYVIDRHIGENYKKVVRPAVFSKRSLLARGEIT